MKINPKSINQIYQTQTKPSTGTKEVSTINNMDKVEVSSLAKPKASLQQIKADLASSINNDYSIDKIKELKTLIQSGKYEVKHRKVAQAIIAFSQGVGNHDD